MFRKIASAEILSAFTTNTRIASFDKAAFDWDGVNYRTDDGYLYVRVRAISSRVNKNHDGWPADELKTAYRTFVGKPIFIDHNNFDPSRTRGVVVDAALHIDDINKTSNIDSYYATAPDNHKPPTWIELLLEVDAKSFPRLAKAIVEKDIDGVSMGANVEYTKCSHCGNRAETPEQFCSHILNKGAIFDFRLPNGTKTSKASYEDCYKVSFFEISFVFDPADETALIRDLKHARTASIQAAIQAEGMSRNVFSDALGGMDFNTYINQIAKEAWDNYILKPAPDPESNAWNAVVTAVRKAGFPQEAIEVANDFRQSYQTQSAEVQEIPEESRGYDTPYEFHPEKMDEIHPTLQEMVQRAPRNNPTMSKTAEAMPPQTDLVHIPEKVNTLRNEKPCPLCGNSLEDGNCGRCGYQDPPEGLDNPDLTKANPDLQMNNAVPLPGPQGQQPPQQPPMNGVPSGGLPPNGQGQGGSMGVMGAAHKPDCECGFCMNKGKLPGSEPEEEEEEVKEARVKFGTIYDDQLDEGGNPPNWQGVMQWVKSPESEYLLDDLMQGQAPLSEVQDLFANFGIPMSHDNQERFMHIVEQAYGDADMWDRQPGDMTLPWGEEGNQYFRNAPPENELGAQNGGFGNYSKKKFGVIYVDPNILTNVKMATGPNLQGGRINTAEKPLLPLSKTVTDRPKNQKTISDSPKPVISKTTKENN